MIARPLSPAQRINGLKFLVFLFAVLVLPAIGYSREPSAEPSAGPSATPARLLDVIDVPTADVLDHYGYFVSFRFGQEGNLQTKTAFGVFPRLNLGFGLDGEHVIGTQDARMNKPTLNVKLRLFDGKDVL